MTNNTIKGKVLIVGQIECLSPLHIGSGKSSCSDMDIALDSAGSPVIPATGFVGILRHAFQDNFPQEFISDKRFNNFWGYTLESDGRQSALCCSDLSFVDDEPQKIIIRDGIRINNENGIVKPGGKFDYELLERGSKFKFKMEFTLREDDEDFVTNTASAIYELLRKQQIRLGAKTNNGLGKVKLIENETKLYSFDFTDKLDVLKWLTQNIEHKKPTAIESLSNIFSVSKRRFCVDLTIKLMNSLIVKSANNDPALPDDTQLKSGDDWIIPGSSLKGAIRARAEKIVNTLELRNKEDLITTLFGNVDDTKPSTKAIKGKMRIEEATMNCVDFPSELQARTKIDRFTGGVITGGLFDSMPIFNASSDKTIAVRIEIEDYHRNEAGLLLLVIKDLWTGDLAVGGEKNIGRGAFEGRLAEITWEDRRVTLESDLSTLSEPDKKDLQSFIEALNKERP